MNSIRPKKAFILAAGNGTRLRPMTDSTPKCLVPIRGVPMLGIWLDLCARYGIGEVTINIHSHAHVVRQYLAQQSYPVSVRVFEEPVLLGSAGTLRENRDWISDENFWIFYGDVLTAMDLHRMYEFHERAGRMVTLGLYAVPNPRACGIATVREGIITNFVEKPENPLGNLAFSGIMLARPGVVDEIPPEVPVDIGFHLLPHLINRMAGYRISEYLVDIGTMESYEAAQKQWPGLNGTSL